MWDFIKTHTFSIFCVLGIIWVAEVFCTKLKYKTKGVKLTGKIVEYKLTQSNYFPVFQFEYEGELLTVDSYQAAKVQSELGTTDTIYYIPGKTKGVFRECDLKPSLSMTATCIAAIAYIILDFTVFHK